MKLQLKHLAPYLPYGIQCELKNEGIQTLMGIEYLFPLEEHKGDFYGYFNEMGSYEPAKFKPLLRPLSELTKEIVHNEQTFSPVKLYVGLPQLETIGNSGYIMMNTLKYDTHRFLIEHHFDVFGLIEKGLAKPIK